MMSFVNFNKYGKMLRKKGRDGVDCCSRASPGVKI